MSNQSAFQPTGQTMPIAVTTGMSTALQVKDFTGAGSNCYRLKWNGNGDVYINATQAPSPTIAVPSAGTAYTGFSMLTNTVEVFTLPPNAWFVTIGAAAVSGTLEVTPGAGI